MWASPHTSTPCELDEDRECAGHLSRDDIRLQNCGVTLFAVVRT